MAYLLSEQRRRFAERWFDHSKRLNDYMELLCHYVCLEVLTASNPRHIPDIVNFLKTKPDSVLEDCGPAVDFFKRRIVYNEGPRGKRNTEEYAKILKNSSTTSTAKIVALLMISTIVRGNIVHGHKLFDSSDDKAITNSCNSFFRVFYNRMFH